MSDIRYGFEVWQDDFVQAGGEAATAEEAMREADHYAMMYGKDGPVLLKFYTRTVVDRADLPRATPSGWHPIETAEPVTALLLWCTHNGLTTGFYYDGCWQSPVGDALTRLYPTHWMPLPEPPK